MKTVVVPSNGNASLIKNYQLVNEMFPGEPIRYIFLELRSLPDNYNDLLTICRNGEVRGKFPGECYEAVARLKNEEEDRCASIDHVYGDSAPVFRNYLEHRNADLVIFDEAQLINHREFRYHDILRMVIRSGAEVLYFPLSLHISQRTTIYFNPVTTSEHEHTARTTAITKRRKGDYPGETMTTAAPASVMARYTSVDDMLNSLESRLLTGNILIHRVSKTGRYFLKHSNIQRLLTESNKKVLWLKK